MRFPLNAENRSSRRFGSNLVNRHLSRNIAELKNIPRNGWTSKKSAWAFSPRSPNAHECDLPHQKKSRDRTREQCRQAVTAGQTRSGWRITTGPCSRRRRRDDPSSIQCDQRLQFLSSARTSVGDSCHPFPFQYSTRSLSPRTYVMSNGRANNPSFHARLYSWTKP